MIAPYRSGDYEYVGVPLDHSQTEEEASGPSTAEIIANQSQDYVDEKLAEYQATIQQLQSKYLLLAISSFHVTTRTKEFNCNQRYSTLRPGLSKLWLF